MAEKCSMTQWGDCPGGDCTGFVWDHFIGSEGVQVILRYVGTSGGADAAFFDVKPSWGDMQEMVLLSRNTHLLVEGGTHGWFVYCHDLKPPSTEYPYGNAEINICAYDIQPDTHCQQDFKVVDQNGAPVQGVIMGGEDQYDFTSFDITGHGNLGTDRFGKISTLRTIEGHQYKFYISSFPPGYDIGDVNIIDSAACTGELLFKILNLAQIPDPCSVNVCVKNQNGDVVPGIAIAISGVGTEYTSSGLEHFGCTGIIGLTCADSITVTATVPAGFSGVKVSETFTASGSKVIYLEIKDETLPPVPEGTFNLNIPSLVMAGDIPVSGDAPAQNQKIQIVAVKKFFGFDYLATDTELAKVTSDAEYKYEAVLPLNEFGIIEVYARIPKDWWAILDKDVTTAKHTVFVLTWEIVLFLIIAAALIWDKKTGKLGILKKKR